MAPDDEATTRRDGPRKSPLPRLTAATSAAAIAADAQAIVATAAVSVPSVTRTKRKLLAPWSAAHATAVPRSCLRGFIAPNWAAASACPEAMAGLFTGPHDAVPTTPKTLVGTPDNSVTWGGVIRT